MQPSFLNLKVVALHCKVSGTFHKEALETLESEGPCAQSMAYSALSGTISAMRAVCKYCLRVVKFLYVIGGGVN